MAQSITYRPQDWQKCVSVEQTQQLTQSTSWSNKQTLAQRTPPLLDVFSPASEPRRNTLINAYKAAGPHNTDYLFEECSKEFKDALKDIFKSLLILAAVPTCFKVTTILFVALKSPTTCLWTRGSHQQWPENLQEFSVFWFWWTNRPRVCEDESSPPFISMSLRNCIPGPEIPGASLLSQESPGTHHVLLLPSYLSSLTDCASPWGSGDGFA